MPIKQGHCKAKEKINLIFIIIAVHSWKTCPRRSHCLCRSLCRKSCQACKNSLQVHKNHAFFLVSNLPDVPFWVPRPTSFQYITVLVFVTMTVQKIYGTYSYCPQNISFNWYWKLACWIRWKNQMCLWKKCIFYEEPKTLIMMVEERGRGRVFWFYKEYPINV